MATPDLRVEVVSLDDLSPDPANARKHSARNVDAIRASLRRFGQQAPLVVGPDGVLVAGSGRLAAMREEGWTHAAVVRTDLEGAERIAFAIADNRTAELADWDHEVLTKLAAGLDVPSEVYGWTQAELDAVAGLAAPRIGDLEGGFANGVVADGEKAGLDGVAGKKSITLVLDDEDAEAVRNAQARWGKDETSQAIGAFCREQLLDGAAPGEGE
jgi:ParB-like chromosome segregation protein Spo0J